MAIGHDLWQRYGRGLGERAALVGESEETEALQERMSAQFPVSVFEDVGHRRLHLSAFIRRRYLGRLQALVCYQTPATEAQRPRLAKPSTLIHSCLHRVSH